MGGKSSQSTQQITIPPEVLARYNAVNARAETAAATPFQQYSTDPNAFVAPLTPTQQAGIANTNYYANTAQPYYGAATGYAAAGGQAVNPGQLDINRYMNPYLGTVVGNAASLLNQQNQMAMSGQTGNAIRQGAFGGDRAGIAAANLAQQQSLAFNNAIAPLLSQGYNTALGTATQQQELGLSAEQANRQAYQQTAQNLAGLGAGAQTAGLQGAQAELTAGQVQQQTQQAGQTALYNQFLQGQSYPFQVAQFLANIAEGTGALSGSTTTGSATISDRRVKHDVHEIGRAFDGQPIYSFKYDGDDRTQIGLMAQDVEKRHPEAVGLAGGMKTVDYGKATHEAARRGHFASGGLAGNSEGGVVHMGHMGEGYAYGGSPMIQAEGFGYSPFMGYDPNAAFQALYGGLLGRGGMGGIGGEGVGGIGIPTGGGGTHELVVPKMEMPTMPDAADRADKFASAATKLKGILAKNPSNTSSNAVSDARLEGEASALANKELDNTPVSDPIPDASTSEHTSDVENAARGGLMGGRHGYALDGSVDDTQDAIPYGGAAKSIVPDEKPGDHKLLQADPASLPKPGGGGLGGILGGLGGLISLIPGAGVIGKGLSAAGSISSGLGYAEGGEVGYHPMHEIYVGDPDISKLIHSIMAAENADYDDTNDDTSYDDTNDDTSAKGEKVSSSFGKNSNFDLNNNLAVSQDMTNTPADIRPGGLAGNLRSVIMHGEGTDKFSNPYDVVYGASPRTGLSPYANPDKPLSSMPIGDVQDFQKSLIGATRGKIRGVDPNMGTGAVGAYQFTRDTLAHLAQKLYGPDWKSIPFNPKVQDELAAELAKEHPYGHRAGIWNAFRHEGPEGAALIAQSGYASGGLAGRAGYAPGGETPQQLRLEDAQAADDAYTANQNQDDQQNPYPEVEPSDKTSFDRAFAPVVAPKSVLPMLKTGVIAKPVDVPEDLGDTPPIHQRGLLGNILHGGFISGLGKGDPDSWIPLIAGIGASMSGPYRGIVGLGQGLAAGAKTAQGMREYERSLLETKINQGRLALAPYALQSQRLDVLARLPQQFTERFARIGTPGAPDSFGYFDTMGQYTGHGPNGSLTPAEFQQTYTSYLGNLGQLAQLPGSDVNLLGLVKGVNPLPIDATSAGTSGQTNMPKAAGDLSTQTPAQGASAPASVTGTQTPAQGVPNGKKLPFRQHAKQVATYNGPAWQNPENYAAESEIPTGMPMHPQGYYTLDTDPKILQQRANVGDTAAINLLYAYSHGQAVPRIAATGQPDQEYQGWASGAQAQSERVQADRSRANAFYKGASNFKQYRDAVFNPSDRMLEAAQAADISRTGQGFVAQFSRELSPYGITGGTTSNANDMATASQKMVNHAADYVQKRYDFSPQVPPPPPPETSAGALFYGLMMQRAIADAAANKADVFYKNATALQGEGKSFGQMSRFERDWNEGNPVTNFLSTDLHRTGFIKGMSAKEKLSYANYLPSVSRGPNGTLINPRDVQGRPLTDPRHPGFVEDGWYKMGNGIVRVVNGRIPGVR